MGDADKAVCWFVQYRVRSKSAKAWGRWSYSTDYLTRRAAVAQCDRKREEAIKHTGAHEEWRVLKVAQEVVH